MTDLEGAWSELHDVVPAGWVVGRPMLREDVGIWEQYAYRPKEKHDADKRTNKRQREDVLHHARAAFLAQHQAGLRAPALTPGNAA